MFGTSGNPTFWFVFVQKQLIQMGLNMRLNLFRWEYVVVSNGFLGVFCLMGVQWENWDVSCSEAWIQAIAGAFQEVSFGWLLVAFVFCVW